MNKTNYKNDNAVFLTMEQAKERYQLCRNTVYENAKDAGAILKIGRSLRIDSQKLDQYLRIKFTL